jgi:hypothetical protein
MVGLVAAGVVTATGWGAGAAYAYWTGRGDGSPAAGAATTTAPATVHVVAVTGAGDPSTLLSPGGTADLVLELDNPNAYPVTMTTIAQGGTVTPTGGGGPGAACTGGSDGTSGVSVPTRTVNVLVASGSPVVVHIPGAASMSTSSVSGCQGASFQIPVTVTVQR